MSIAGVLNEDLKFIAIMKYKLTLNQLLRLKVYRQIEVIN